MAEKYTLSAQIRTVHKKSARDTRLEGLIPGVVYGNKVDPVSISLNYSDFLRTYRKSGTASLIDLDIDGKKTKILVHDVNIHPTKMTIEHVDLYVVNLKEATIVEVPLVFVGEPPAVKNLGGIFTKEHESIEIRCLPTEIPHDIEVDISSIENLHEHITIADLKLDKEKFEIMHLDEGTSICSVLAPRIEEEISTEAPESDMGNDEDGDKEGDTDEKPAE
jgi:large subunit ribosomal protein L25